jgi:tetratricopeptide (TPR) repeat protein
MRLLLVVVVAAMLAPATAHAQTAPTANDQEAARAHFMAGSAYYEQANYSDAAKEFNEAYRLSQRPDLLYNIALAYERLEKWDDAIASLQKYLRDKPDAQDRSIIQTRIENLEKRRDAIPSPAPVVAQPPPPAKARPRHVASLVVGGLGVAALGAAIGTGVSALQAQSDLDAVCMNKTCPLSAQNRIDEGSALALATDVLIGVGAAAVVVGVVLLIVESRRPPARSSTRSLHLAASPAGHLRPAPGGLAVTF